jgi:hypothetical protein
VGQRWEQEGVTSDKVLWRGISLSRRSELGPAKHLKAVRPLPSGGLFFACQSALYFLRYHTDSYVVIHIGISMARDAPPTATTSSHTSQPPLLNCNQYRLGIQYPFFTYLIHLY